ncbi:MAG: hypothetical protein ACI4S1_03450, partial [Roseburia sp.]
HQGSFGSPCWTRTNDTAVFRALDAQEGMLKKALFLYVFNIFIIPHFQHQNKKSTQKAHCF